MKILVIGKFAVEDFALHIAETLGLMGHQVVRFDIGYHSTHAEKSITHVREKIGRTIYGVTDQVPLIRSYHMRKLWDLFEHHNPIDVVIVCYDFLWPGEVERIKQCYRTRIVVWFPDAIINIGRGYLFNAPYDAIFFKDPYIVKILDDVLPAPVYYLPECCNPKRHVLPPSLTDEEMKPYRCDVTTVGNMHSYRVAFFSHLDGYNIKIWGTPPPFWLNIAAVTRWYQEHAVRYQEKAKAFRAAKIVVNNIHYAEIWGLNARTFEVAAAGAFQMLDWRPGLNQLFADGKEVVSFTGIADLKSKIDYYLAHDDKRETIAQAGMRRAFKDHTYELRLALLLDTIAGRKNGYPLPHIEYK